MPDLYDPNDSPVRLEGIPGDSCIPPGKELTHSQGNEK